MFRADRRINLLDTEAIEKMVVAGELAARLLKHLGKMVKPGISTNDLDKVAETFAADHHAINAPLNYNGFPKSICTSVNDVVCHGIPNPKHILRDGDIVKIDVTLIVNGYHGDTCATFFVGEPSEEARQLVQVTANSLKKGFEAVAIGARMGDIGYAVQTYAESLGYGVVREFQGHGIHRVFHTAPDVPNYGRRNTGPRMRRGMSFTIEPMINTGDWPTRILDDDWTAVTRDGSLSSQFEHTMIVTADGPLITTVTDGDDPMVISPGGTITYTV